MTEHEQDDHEKERPKPKPNPNSGQVLKEVKTDRGTFRFKQNGNRD